MKYFCKRFKGIIILILIETFFFFKMENIDSETFFFVWSVIALVLLLYNIFDINENTSLMGLGGNSSTTLANLTSSFIKRKYDTDKSKKRSGGGLYNSMNLLYLFFLVANIIGYIIVMPK